MRSAQKQDRGERPLDERVRERIPLAEARSNPLALLPASQASTLVEAEKPQVDELIQPVAALAGPAAHGPGLVGFTDRVEAVDGTLRIQSRAGRRTGNLVELPLAAPQS